MTVIYTKIQSTIQNNVKLMKILIKIRSESYLRAAIWFRIGNLMRDFLMRDFLGESVIELQCDSTVI